MINIFYNALYNAKRAHNKKATFYRQEIAQVINSACGGKQPEQDKKTIVIRLIGIYGSKPTNWEDDQLQMKKHIHNWLAGKPDTVTIDGKPDTVTIDTSFSNNRKRTDKIYRDT